MRELSLLCTAPPPGSVVAARSLPFFARRSLGWQPVDDLLSSCVGMAANRHARFLAVRPPPAEALCTMSLKPDETRRRLANVNNLGRDAEPWPSAEVEASRAAGAVPPEAGGLNAAIQRSQVTQSIDGGARDEGGGGAFRERYR